MQQELQMGSRLQAAALLPDTGKPYDMGCSLEACCQRVEVRPAGHCPGVWVGKLHKQGMIEAHRLGQRCPCDMAELRWWRRVARQGWRGPDGSPAAKRCASRCEACCRSQRMVSQPLGRTLAHRQQRRHQAAELCRPVKALPARQGEHVTLMLAGTFWHRAGTHLLMPVDSTVSSL